jgi:AcrR family transcriptional regulator
MRVRDRRERILAAAADLFREKGFHAVGIDEIGTAAGITGPGVYRHFDGKDGLLVAVLREATEELWHTPEGDVTLVDYVRRHVEFAVAHGDTIDLWHREGRNLPKDAQDAQRQVVEAYVDGWASVLLEQRPDLAPAEAHIRVRATLGLVHSLTHPDMAGAPAAVVERMALAGLLA